MRNSSAFLKAAFVSIGFVLAVSGLRGWEKTVQGKGRAPSAVGKSRSGSRFNVDAFNRALGTTLRDSRARAELVNLLVETYRPRVRKLARAIRTYHYGNRGPLSQDPFSQASPVPSSRGYFDAKRTGVGVVSLEDPNAYRTPIELSPPEASDYFKTKAGLLFGKGTSEGAAGPGLYAAVDPIQSETYAGNPWFLLEIEAPEGTKYLEEQDLYRVDGEFFDRFLKDEDLRAAFFARSDKKYWKLGENSYFLSKEFLIDSPAIRSLLNDALQKLEIDFLLYPWTEGGIVHCAVTGPGGVGAELAMNFINSEFLVRGGKLTVFVGALEANPPAEKAKRYLELLEILELGYARFWFPPSYPNAQNNPGPSPTPSPAAPRDGDSTDYAIDYGYSLYNSMTYLKKAVFLTYGWNEILGRTSAWVPEIVSAEEAKGVSEFYGRFYDSSSAIPKGKVIFHGLIVRTRTTTSTSSTGQMTYTQAIGNLDAELRLKAKLGAKKLAEILERVSEQTFGCSKKYPDEHLHMPTD
jgi:hypothetical protein